ncbi:DUF397 domain-containing protein [Nocardia sp. CC227C]|uniref:DUF397 domain-containing protein n=1 Tax=Nocardia sp. CC227C TaxID=3044562 RepID=UPI00278C068A|nr:DUF397 domain-containing protein [Nocardia sp. CC227C]
MSSAWYKSTYSGSEATCVEVAHRGDAVLIRDSKFTGPSDEQPIVSVAPAQWRSVLDLVLSGESGAAGDVSISIDPSAGAAMSDCFVTLSYNAAEWDAFMKGVADGQFDRRA